MLIVILVVMISLYLFYFEYYSNIYPVFISDRGFTPTYRPYDFYNSLRQDNVYTVN